MIIQWVLPVRAPEPDYPTTPISALATLGLLPKDLDTPKL